LLAWSWSSSATPTLLDLASVDDVAPRIEVATADEAPRALEVIGFGRSAHGERAAGSDLRRTRLVAWRAWRQTSNAAADRDGRAVGSLLSSVRTAA
jgi:hypothetical protein